MGERVKMAGEGKKLQKQQQQHQRKNAFPSSCRHSRWWRRLEILAALTAAAAARSVLETQRVRVAEAGNVAIETSAILKGRALVAVAESYIQAALPVLPSIPAA